MTSLLKKVCGLQERRGQDREVDIHIWKKGEDAYMSALYTISVGQGAICVDMPIDGAMDSLREYLEERIEHP